MTATKTKATLCALALFGGVAALQLSARAADMITNPGWVQKPTGEMFAHLYPDGAYRDGLGARVVVRCQVAVTGNLEACHVLTESPPDLGFGAATLALASRIKMSPRLRNGVPEGGAEIELPVVWNPPAPSAGHTFTTIIQTPTPAMIAAAFPSAAVGKVSKARVLLGCGVTRDQSLGRCQIYSDSAPNLGFERAAIQLTAAFKVQVSSQTLPLSDALVEIPLTFHDPAKPAPPVRIAQPIWTQWFEPTQLASIYPAQAKSAGVRSGSAMLDCTVAHSGKLTACQVIEEKPLALGFGDAALKVADAMAMSPWTPDGEPVDGAHIRLPIELQAPKGAIKPSSP